MATKSYRVMSPVKVGGKLRPVGAIITADEEIVGEVVDQGHLEESKAKPKEPETPAASAAKPKPTGKAVPKPKPKTAPPEVPPVDGGADQGKPEGDGTQQP